MSSSSSSSSSLFFKPSPAVASAKGSGKNREEHRTVEIDAISDAQAKELSNFSIDFEEMIRSLVDARVEDYEYDGFNPVDFKRFFLSVLVNGLKLDPAACKLVVVKCLVLISMRGVKIDMVAPKAKTEALAFLKYLKESVGLTLNPKNGAPGNRVITLQRIAAVFPVEMSMLLLVNEKARVIGDVPAEYPRYLCHPNAPAFFPLEITAEHALMKGYRKWRLSFTNVITANSLGDELEKTVDKFNDIVFKSSLLTAAERKAGFLKILKQDSKSKTLKEAEKMYDIIVNNMV